MNTQITTKIIKITDIDNFDRLNSLVTVKIQVSKTAKSWWRGEKSILTSVFLEQFLRIGEGDPSGTWYHLGTRKIYRGPWIKVTVGIDGGKLLLRNLENQWLERYAENKLQTRVQNDQKHYIQNCL